MGFARRAWEWVTLAGVPVHTFAADEPAPRPIDRVISAMMSGTGRVTREDALSVPAVLRARNMICSVSTLPLRQINATTQTTVPLPLLDQIDPDVPNLVTLAQTVEDLLFEGLSWWLVTARDKNRWPTAAQHYSPASVTLNPPASGKTPQPLPAGYDPRGVTIYVDGKPAKGSDLIRFDSPNPALLVAGGRAVRRALLLEKMAALYADGGRPLDYFTPTDGVDPADDSVIEEILDDWEASRKTRSTAYVPAAMTYNTVDVPTPADLQLVELQKRATLDLANATGLDPEDLGVSTTSRTYQNATDRRKDRINDVYSPYMLAITGRLSMNDVTRRANRVVFNLDDYLKADPTTRAQYHQVMVGLGAWDATYVRNAEGVPGPAPARAEPAPAAPEADNVRQLRATAARFDAPQHTFVDVPVAEFSVDVERRTIRGRILPFGEVGITGGRRYSFDRNSLVWEGQRVKLLRDHDYAQAHGTLVEMTQDAAGGYDAAFRVASGADGDRILALAAEGVLDGFSVGVDFVLGTDTYLDGGVHRVRRAVLKEVSLVAMPAFDGARVTSVAASRDQGGTMRFCQNCGAQLIDGVTHTCTPENASTPAAFTADQLAQLRAIFGTPAAPAAPAPADDDDETPAQVGFGRVQVTEPEPYRFDARGNLRAGSHDFSSDMIAGSKGDAAALDRAQGFMRAQFDIDRADAVAINPQRQRPDLYVDQRQYRYPMWEAINKGTLPDSTPFVLPKFNSSSGLVANHTEGTEPTPGTFTATSQTITPGAVSGKVEITREAWDQGGNPMLSGLVWRQMERAYYEALEARAVAVLDAATPTQLATFTAGGGTNKATLVAELTAGLATLQFVRGGFSMDNAFLQIDLYKDLIAAKDGNGRPLYPALGPQNTMGTTRDRFGSIEIAPGVVGYPAWALAASGSVAASSYLFDSDSVHGWATSPQRLQFEYRVAYIDIAMWGYAATAITDLTGVREITYDPVA